VSPRPAAARFPPATGGRGAGADGGGARPGAGRVDVDPYRAVDRQADPRRFAGILEARGRQPHQARLRRGFLSLAGVGPRMRVLDVGCGTGVVTRDIAARVGAGGAAVGVDPSRALLAVARRRARDDATGARPTFRHGDGLALPFAPASFDVSLAVTVLLHVPASDRVLGEMIRVTRPGGHVAVLDQDFGTFVLDVPDRALTRRLVDGHADRFYAEPWSGRTLARRLRLAGLRRVRARAFVVVDPVYDDYVRSMLERRVELATRWRVVTADDGRRWLRSVESSAARGDFFMSLNYYGAVGIRA
jgi:SAM-dependent methyltransferase